MARPRTADQILEAARRRFNEKGYTATTLAEIAAAVEISQGNLTYHFPTKRDLVTRIQQVVAERIGERAASHRPGDVEDDYIGHVRFGMELMATYRFLLRDDAQIEPGPDHQSPHQVLIDDYAALRRLLERIDEAGLFRRDVDVDIDVLTRALWVLGRFWMDYLNEMELRDDLGPEDQHRGAAHHLALLRPNLTAPGRRRFDAALERASVADAEPPSRGTAGG